MADPHSSSSDEKQTGTGGFASYCGSRTETETIQDGQGSEQSAPTLQLRLNQPKTGQKVKWAADTVDNEFMGKKKSKCCCIFEKPKVFGESSSEDEEDGEGCTPHCKGHKKKCYRKGPHNQDDNHSHDNNNNDGGAGPGPGSQNGITAG